MSARIAKVSISETAILAPMMIRVEAALWLGHGEGRADLVRKQRLEIPRFLFRSVMRDDLGIAGIGGLTAKNDRGEARHSENLVHEAELDLSVTLPTEFRAEMADPQALPFHFAL